MKKTVWANIYIFEASKNSVLANNKKTMHNVSVLLKIVYVSSKQRLTLAKKNICLHQTEPLFEPNRASVYI